MTGGKEAVPRALDVGLVALHGDVLVAVVEQPVTRDLGRSGRTESVRRIVGLRLPQLEVQDVVVVEAGGDDARRPGFNESLLAEGPVHASGYVGINVGNVFASEAAVVVYNTMQPTLTFFRYPARSLWNAAFESPNEYQVTNIVNPSNWSLHVA